MSSSASSSAGRPAAEEAGTARDELGQAATELALVLPLLVLLLLAVVQLTLVARDQLLVVHAARAAAREAAVDPRPATVEQAAAKAASTLKSTRLRAEVSPNGGEHRLVTVDVRYRAPTDVPLVGPLLPDVELRAKAAMRMEVSG
jgi:Flp pilus assembly protein TadG